MTIRKFGLLGSVAALVLMTACAPYPTRDETYRTDSYGGQPGHVNSAIQFGYVDRIEVIAVANRSSGGGAVLGAVLGAVVGNQIGHGSGRAAATGLGAVGGAVVGSNIENRNRGDHEVYRVSVRLDNGQFNQFDYQFIGDLRVGDRIRVEGGQLYRQ